MGEGALPSGKGKEVLSSLGGEGRPQIFPPFAEQVIYFHLSVFGTLTFAKMCYYSIYYCMLKLIHMLML